MMRFKRIVVSLKYIHEELFPGCILLSCCFFHAQSESTCSIEALAQPAFTYSKLTIETLEQGAKYVQS